MKNSMKIEMNLRKLLGLKKYRAFRRKLGYYGRIIKRAVKRDKSLIRGGNGHIVQKKLKS